MFHPVRVVSPLATAAAPLGDAVVVEILATSLSGVLLGRVFLLLIGLFLGFISLFLGRISLLFDLDFVGTTLAITRLRSYWRHPWLRRLDC